MGTLGVRGAAVELLLRVAVAVGASWHKGIKTDHDASMDPIGLTLTPSATRGCVPNGPTRGRGEV